MKDILYVAISLIGVLGLFFMVAWGLRKISRRVSFVGGGRLRILDRANLGRDSMLLVVSVCDKLMLIGVSGQNTQKLADLDMSEEEYLDVSKNASGGAGFFDIFSGVLNKNKKSTETENREESNEDKGNS